jgi:Family of unknown function (DUF6178)
MPDIKLPGRKEIGHLTLLRESRRITAKEFNALAPAERLEIIRQARGSQKYQLLLEAGDGEALTTQMAAQELFLLIKELGREDVGELVAWASTEQFTTFLDLDIWRGDRLDPAAMLNWLQMLLDAGDEKVMELAYQLDFELLVLMVKKFVNISRGPEDASEDDQGGQPASGYEVEYLDLEGGKVVGALLDVLYQHDPQLTHNLLRTVRWEQNSLLEEEVFQARNRRLEEFGFVDPIEALAIFSWLDPATFDPEAYRKDALPLPGDGSVPPGFLLTAAAPRELLAEVLANGLSPEGCWELSYLLNAVMSADRVDVGDPAQVQAALDQVYRCLNLALEHLCGRDAVAATEVFHRLYLKPLFRLGFSLSLQLQRQAKPLRTSPPAPYFGAADRHLLTALGGAKPQFYTGLASPESSEIRPFKTLQELQLAAEALARLELQVALLTQDLAFEIQALDELDLSGCVPAQAADLRVSDLFLTALANRLLGRGFSPQPVPVAELPRLHGMVCQDGRLQQALVLETRAWLEGLRPGGAALAETWLAVWAEEFCPLAPEGIDPRFLGGLIVRL